MPAWASLVARWTTTYGSVSVSRVAFLKYGSKAALMSSGLLTKSMTNVLRFCSPPAVRWVRLSRESVCTAVTPGQLLVDVHRREQRLVEPGLELVGDQHDLVRLALERGRQVGAGAGVHVGLGELVVLARRRAPVAAPGPRPRPSSPRRRRRLKEVSASGSRGWAVVTESTHSPGSRVTSMASTEAAGSRRSGTGPARLAAMAEFEQEKHLERHIGDADAGVVREVFNVVRIMVIIVPSKSF